MQAIATVGGRGRNARRGSISRRLTRTLVLTTVGCLVAAFAAIVALDAQSQRASLVERAETLAEVVGGAGALPLARRDRSALQRALAGLAAAEPVQGAVIFDRRGVELARWVRPGARLGAIRGGAPGAEFAEGRLDLRRPVLHDGDEVGSIVIRWDTSERRARLLSFIGLLAALVAAVVAVAALVSTRLRGQVSQPLRRLVEGSEAIAEGNLATTVNVSTRDEIGLLGRTFNAMAESLRGLVSQVRHGTHEVREVVRRLEESGGRLAYESQRQAAAVTGTQEAVDSLDESIRGVNRNVERLAQEMRDTSSSISEMQASITEVASHMDHLANSIGTTSGAVNRVAGSADEVVEGVETLVRAADDTTRRLGQLKDSVERVRSNAQESDELSEDASREARRGLEAVNETIASMGEISTSFHELEQSISRLVTKSFSIDAILKVIQGVADQTTMLSLNASIIAAQAGEHGRAFSVVADEVNNLARSTQRATHEIADLVGAVQDETAAAVAATEEGAAKVERGVQRSRLAGQILRAISEKAELSSERVNEILEAASVQIHDLEEVDRSLADVNEIVQRFGRSARAQQTATGEIARAIDEIRALGSEVRRSLDEQRRGSVLITEAVSAVANLVNDIAQASGAQTRSSEEIQHALRVFRDVTGETAARAVAINETVAMLSERSRQLANEIDRFETGPESREADRVGLPALPEPAA